MYTLSLFCPFSTTSTVWNVRLLVNQMTLCGIVHYSIQSSGKIRLIHPLLVYCYKAVVEVQQVNNYQTRNSSLGNMPTMRCTCILLNVNKSLFCCSAGRGNSNTVAMQSSVALQTEATVTVAMQSCLLLCRQRQ